MVEFKFEYKGRKVCGKGEPFVDSEFFYITADPALEDSKLQKFEELIKLEIINLESPLNKYTNFCQSEKYEDKTYFSFKINFPTILFMDKDKKEATITQIVFYLIDRLDRLIEKF
jgi:hypothetical protein